MSQIPKKTPKDAGIPSKIEEMVVEGDQKYILSKIKVPQNMEDSE